jgi:hypothetical protein
MMTPAQRSQSITTIRRTFDAIISFYDELTDEAFHELYERMIENIEQLEHDAKMSDITKTKKLQVLTKTDTFINNQVPQEES